MRFVSLALAIAPVSVLASFDLVIVQDRIDSTFIEFKRYDGGSGLYLGAFGRHGVFSGALTSMSTNSAIGAMYTLSATGIRKWNYSTGADLGYVNLGATSMNAVSDSVGNFIGVNGNNQILKYNVDGTDETIALPAGVVARWIVRQADGRWYVGDSSSGGRIFRSSTTNVNSSYSLFAAASVLAENSRSVYMSYEASFSGAPHFMFHTRSSGSAVFEGLNPTFTTVGVSGGFGTLTHSISRDLAPGHDGSAYFMGVNGSGVAGIERWVGDNSVVTIPAASNLVNPLAMTSVLAPEPATLLILALPLAAAMRRRRSG